MVQAAWQLRAWQAAVVVGGLVPVGAGLAGVLLGPAMVGAPDPGDLDSHFRYLSGLLLAIGLAFWSTIPGDESGRFGLLTFVVVLGGLARLSGVFAQGLPSLPMLGGLGMELAVTPALWWWQRRLRRGGA
ncbi:MAG: DUF4345 domain-containing protein [Acidisphaera sp.]|nr:DUF4345 domain-containing protein [Acidisphaera sp.]